MWLNFFKNYCSTIVAISFVVLFYQTVPYYVWFFNKVFAIPTRNVTFHSDRLFLAIWIVYAIGLLWYYYIYSSPSTARQIWSYLISQTTSVPQTRSPQIKQYFLKFAVKFFFAPLMVFWMTDHCVTLINNLYAMSGDIAMFWSDFSTFFIKHLFWNLFSLILFLDVFFFTIWYLTERDILDNNIKSVQPYAIWWIVALMCYPPFNTVTSSILQRYSTDFPQFAYSWLTVVVGLLICVLMGIYTWASISLGWKASNLTNRGIVSHGPYAYIRHPAYICKNAAWTLGALPVIFKLAVWWDWFALIWVLFSLLGRWAIYYARALTEEMHLWEDPDYLAYRQKVKYRYIPGLF